MASRTPAIAASLTAHIWTVKEQLFTVPVPNVKYIFLLFCKDVIGQVSGVITRTLLAHTLAIVEFQAEPYLYKFIHYL